jgi:endonuclease/exonuclease/phosphatase (EEP) superfamily protein YafD
VRERGRHRGARAAPLLLLLALGGCEIAHNYEDPAGPRYAGDFVAATPSAGPVLRVVTYNLALGEEVDTAIAALSRPPLAQADVILMQEMDAPGVERIARALGLRYVYYPAFIQKDGDDFGNAVLTPWPLLADRKVLLPSYDPYVHSRRTATVAVLELAGHRAAVASMHSHTLGTGLGARLDQSDALCDALEATAQESGAALRFVGGDFNTPDLGAGAQVVELFLGRDYAWASEGAGDTVDWLLGSLVSDYVFSRGASALARGVDRGDTGTDHRPIWVEFAWPP